MNFFWVNQQWLLIGVVFFGIIFYIAWIRWRDRKWIEKRFGSRQVMAMSFGINFFGKASEPGPPRRSSGFLLLLSDRLFYRSRMAKIELDISTTKITNVYHGRNHKGVDLHQSVIKVDFINEQNRKDTAVFKVPYPPQWIRAIESTLAGKTENDHQ